MQRSIRAADLLMVVGSGTYRNYENYFRVKEARYTSVAVFPEILNVCFTVSLGTTVKPAQNARSLYDCISFLRAH